jgi:hypothetical protein
MPDEINRERRALFSTAAATLAATQLSFSGLAHAEPAGSKAGALLDVKPGTHTSFSTIKQINAGLLNVG